MKDIDLDKPHKFFFETLGSRVRWNIIQLLRKKECSVNEISATLSCEQSLISHHLKRLTKCGFVFVSQKGNERIYKLNNETIEPLLKLVEQHVNTFCKGICCVDTNCK